MHPASTIISARHASLGAPHAGWRSCRPTPRSLEKWIRSLDLCSYSATVHSNLYLDDVYPNLLMLESGLQ